MSSPSFHVHSMSFIMSATIDVKFYVLGFPVLLQEVLSVVELDSERGFYQMWSPLTCGSFPATGHGIGNSPFTTKCLFEHAQFINDFVLMLSYCSMLAYMRHYFSVKWSGCDSILTYLYRCVCYCNFAGFK